MYNKLVKMFRFSEEERSTLTFSDTSKIRLNPETNRIELKSTGISTTNGRVMYPIDADIYVKTRVTNPEALTKWLGFHFDPISTNLPTGTSIGFKLNDGTTDLYWNGSAWATAGVSDWNDEGTIAANIETFHVTKQLQVIANLVTTDQYETPYLEGVCLLMEVEMDSIGSIIADSLIPSLRESFRPVMNYALRAELGGDKLHIYDVANIYNIVTIDRVFNHTTDPDHITDILSSYSTDEGIVTVNTNFEQGDVAWMVMTIEPEIVFNWSDQDYTEVEKLPAVVVDRFTVSGNQTWGKAYVRDFANLTSFVKTTPYRMAIDIDISLVAEKNRTLFALIEQSLKHINNNPMLRWRAIDEPIALTVVSEPEYTPRPDLREGRSSSYSIRLEDIYIWLGYGEETPLVQRLNLNLTAPELSHAPRYTGARHESP